LLGEPDEFYRILTAEEHSHGSAITPLIARIKGDFQKLRLASSPSWRAKAKDLIANLDLEYESRNIKGCAAAAFELMMLLAECRQGPRYDGNAYVFLTALDLTDPRFAAGVWYLAVLNGVFERATTSASLAAVRELDEIRLAIFILASWARDISRHPSPQAFIIASTEGDPSSQPQKTDGI